MFHAPRQLPPLECLLSDLGNPAPAVVAKALGVSVRSVYGWQAQGAAPRPAALAIFWETRWGRSVVDCRAVNGQQTAQAYARALESEKATLLARVAYLESVGVFGSANAPTLAPATSWRNGPAACASLSR